MDILSNLVKMGLTLKYSEFDLCSFDGKYGSGREKAWYADSSRLPITKGLQVEDMGVPIYGAK